MPVMTLGRHLGRHSRLHRGERCAKTPQGADEAHCTNGGGHSAIRHRMALAQGDALVLTQLPHDPTTTPA